MEDELVKVGVSVEPKTRTGPWVASVRIDDGTETTWLAFHFRLSEGAPELTGASLERSTRITPSMLQRFSWGQWATVAGEAVRRVAEGRTSRIVGPGEALFGSIETAVERHSGVKVERMAGKKRNKPGPKPARGDEFYQSIADRYSSLLATGSRNPSQTLADELGYERSTVRGFVRQARARGFLRPAQHGKAG